MPSTNDNSSRQLQDAFELFNEASGQLVNSYAMLEQEVKRLNDEKERQHVAVRDMAERLQNLINSLPAAIVVVDKRGLVVECNAMACALLGNPLAGAAWHKVIRRNFKHADLSQTYVEHRNGRYLLIDTRPLGREPGQIVLISDHTDNRRMEQAMQRHQRLSAMGEMVARVAHQIRTPLATAMIYASQLKSMLPQSQAREFSHQLHDCLHHLNQMVSDMLLFSKGDDMKVEVLCAGDIMHRLQQICVALQKEDLPIRFENRAGQARILANAQGLLGALENLIGNAVQASTAPASVRLSAFVDPDYLAFAVRDNGVGMSEQVRQRIFEPFFSTKSGGTGLGLAVVRAVVTAHQGDLDVQTHAGGGSCFIVRFPLLSERENGLTLLDPVMVKEAGDE